MVRTASRCFLVLVLLAQTASWVSAQGLNTTASKDDWEEINFEFNSSVLADGFPSLLRLAELLQANPSYRVRVEGHTDGIGSASFNEKLGLARATMVRDFLVKYGAQTGQMDVVSRGKTDPKVPNPNPKFSATDVARYMNRRVVLTVMDGQGRTVGAGGAGDAIRALNAAPPTAANQAAQAAATAANMDCCSEVLKRLDKLDDIARMLKDLADQNADLRRQLDGLKASEQALENKVNQPVPQPPKPPTATEVAQEVKQELDAAKLPKFQLLGVNAGEDTTGHVSLTGSGRFFEPFGHNFGFQAQMEYFYMHGQKEGQADIGLVDRLGRHVEAGLFSSFKNVSLAGDQTSGTLGQGAFTMDYIFSRGKIGLFGTKGFLDNALVNTTHALDINGNVLNNILLESYLKVVDQAGVSASIGLWGNNYAQGNLGYLKSVAFGDHLGGTLKLVFPINNRIAITAEGGVNETMINVGNSGRAVFGVEFGNMLRPKQMLAATHAIPMEVPRVHYEVLTKRVRIGNDAPIANAGPNMSNVPAGTVTLDGSASYDPDGDPITYQWIQEAGNQVTLSSPTSAKTTFTASAGTTYIFRLIVKDNQGGQGQADVRITTVTSAGVQIVSFTATPTQIQAGQTSTLVWNVLNATSVVISGIGPVAAAGATSVSPTQTTTYTLTAVNSVNQLSLAATVTVTPAGGGVGSQPLISSCFATPSNIVAGQTATLTWATGGATNVAITPGVGTVAQSGTFAVTPTATTTYTLTATGAAGTQPATCNIAVTVTAAQMPQITRFSAIPATINAGQTSTLLWVVTNATTVSISPNVGTVAMTGTQDVTPAVTTVYTLTATNSAGTVTSTATVTVNAGGVAPHITSFTATPPTSPSAGSNIVLACSASNATTLNVAGVAFTQSSATLTVAPQQTTTYTCVAGNGQSQTDSATLTVTVPGGGGSGSGPVIVLPDTLFTATRFIILDASGSFSPAGNNPLKFFWTSLDGKAAVANPTSATPNVWLNIGTGPWVLQVVATDSKGNSSSKQITVTLTQAP